MEKILQKTPLEEHEAKLKNRFTVLIKNREALCDENGELKSMSYAKAYNKLLNEVGDLTSKVASDMTVNTYRMSEDKKKACIDNISSEYGRFEPRFKQAIKCGSYDDLTSVMKDFCSSAMDVYLQTVGTFS